MKSLVVVDSLNGVKNNLNIFNQKNIDIITFDFIASEYLKKNFKKKSKNIFDFYNKSERFKIFLKSNRVLSTLLGNLDKDHSNKISKILGIKKISIYQILLKNILFYEFFSIFYLRIVLKKIFKKKYKKVFIIKNKNINISKVFRIEDQIKSIAQQNKIDNLIILTNSETKKLTSFWFLFLRIITNYKFIFVKLYNIFHSKYLKIKNYNNKKNCLSFFEDNLLEKIILQKGYKVFILSKILQNINKNVLKKIFLLFNKIKKKIQHLIKKKLKNTYQII